ncbi:MAG: YhcH/YjgK/YiaL family protein [Lachnospiraceae bacterium]|nr:YhcH/YjgK/YiaL family protein [Lachnospiraceae bacterium]
MIVDKVSNMKQYAGVIKYTDEIMAFTKKVMSENVENGRYDLIGDDLYALVQRYPSKALASARLEAHKVYADLQVVVSGREKIYYDEIGDQTLEDDFKEGKDICFFHAGTGKGAITFTDGFFAYLAPQDAHMPGMQVEDGKPEDVVKIVFKIKL